ncbi:hypothetical protein ACH5RR_038259 [Cinchona calisaya]|uniref:Uncharacterized protein n=1 Tax=Cinchona calisaya TaxID=153742 RepID=A0ABD2XXD1_9GENT
MDLKAISTGKIAPDSSLSSPNAALLAGISFHNTVEELMGIKGTLSRKHTAIMDLTKERAHRYPRSKTYHSWIWLQPPTGMAIEAGKGLVWEYGRRPEGWEVGSKGKKKNGGGQRNRWL